MSIDLCDIYMLLYSFCDIYMSILDFCDIHMLLYSFCNIHMSILDILMDMCPLRWYVKSYNIVRQVWSSRQHSLRQTREEDAVMAKTHVPSASYQAEADLQKNHVQTTFARNLRLVTFNWYEGRAKSSGTIMCMYRGARRPKNIYYVQRFLTNLYANSQHINTCMTVEMSYVVCKVVQPTYVNPRTQTSKYVV